LKLSAEQKAATAIDDNLVVNAGAGSGKTTVLTARYIRLLEEGGLAPAQIVAITFTKKAAREMRERIDEQLAVLSRANARWQEAREQLISAPIGTIHSFYARVLRAFPVEAGINPAFRVLDELESSRMLDQAVTAAFQQAAAEKCPYLALLTEILGAQALEEGGSLAQQIRHLYTTLLNRGIPVAEASLSELYNELPPWQQSRDNLDALAAGEAELAASLAGKDKPELIRTRRIVVQAARDLAALTEPSGLVELYPVLLAVTGLKGGRTKGHKEFISSGVLEVQNLLSRGLAPVLGQAVLELLGRLDRVFAEIKAKAGGLDFSDLQFAMWHLLQQPQVAAALGKKYLTYMIDEFQDTDRLQHRIIVRLVQQEDYIPPGRLFIVGDAKQSIYRFRGADVGVFNLVRKQLTQGNPQREKRITCNFRSRKPLIDLVNSLFSRLMGGEGEMEYIPLSSFRSGEAPCAEIVVCPEDADSLAAGEAAAMAARIREMVERRELLVGDRDNPQPVKYGDVAILIRSRTHIKEYEHHLRLEGVPYTVAGGIGFYEQQEVQDLLNLLRAVRNSRDDISLIAALRSPLFSLDDDSLYALVRSREQDGGSLLDQVTVLKGEQQRRLERARDVISQLQSARGRLELPRLLELALDLTWYREAILTGHAGLQRYANIDKLVDLAESFAAVSHDEDFLSWVEYAATQNEAEAKVDSEQSNSVRIMTIHASKGLQFPVVILPLANTKIISRFGAILLDNQGKLAFNHPWQCPVWAEVKEQERLREVEEYKRLLYVAITRARDRLVFLTKAPGKEEQSFNYWISDFASHAPSHFGQREADPASGRMQLPLPLPEPGPAETQNPVMIFPVLARVGSSRTIRYFSISQFLLWQQDREQFNRQYLSRWLLSDSMNYWGQNMDDWQHEPGGASFGSLLHSALEAINAKTDLAALLGALVPAHFPAADKDQKDRIFYAAKTLIEGYRQDPGPPGAFTSSVSEQEFYYRLGDALFYGIIDRLLFADEHVAVVDYKTNKIPSEGIHMLVESYAPQLRFYALAAAEIYRRPVRAYLQLLRQSPGHQTIEIDLSIEKEEELRLQLLEFVDYCSQN